MKALVAGMAMMLLSGCASIRAMQKPVTAEDVAPDRAICPSVVDLDGEASHATERGAYRDKIIMVCIGAINKRYAEFKTSLHQDSTTTNLASDILALGLSGGASLAGKTAANGLSAGSAFVLATNKAISKDVFYDLTLPAIEASMDAGRANVLKGIIQAQQADTSGTKYTLERASYDISAYQAAGNLYAAISQLTKTATVQAEMAQKDVAEQQAGIPNVTVTEILPPDVDARVNVLAAKIKALKDPADGATLDQVLAKLNQPAPSGASFVVKQITAIKVIQADVSLGGHDKDAAAMAAIEQALNPIFK